MRAHFGVAALVAGLVLLVAPAAHATVVHTVSVTGAVASPATYTAAQLAAMPATTYPVTNARRGTPSTVTGVDLETVANLSAPTVPAGKNTTLRVTLTVTGRSHRAVTFALGELDPSFGAHPAVLTTSGGSVGLIVPADRDRSRSVVDVTSVRVAVSTAAVSSGAPGSVRVITAHRTVTLSPWLLAHLPRQTETVTFLAGTTSETLTESGPPLSLALLAAGVLPTPNTAVVAVGDDGYGAAVTLAEAYVGNRPLLLSTNENGAALAEPRLIANGDIKGGRDVSGVVTLQAG